MVSARFTRKTPQDLLNLQKSMSARDSANREGKRKKGFCDRSKLRSAFLHVGLNVLCCSYILVGAYVFRSIERPLELQRRGEARRDFETLKENLLENAWNNPEILEELLDDFTFEMLELFEDPITAHTFESFYTNYSVEKDLWTLSNAVLFTSTTVIPVGYGYITPISQLGRLLVVVYGLVGIPLALVTMADAGKFLSQFATRWCEESLAIPTIVFLSLLSLYPVLGGVLFYYFARMPFLDAIYFSLTSIFTIGFGDLTPQVNIVYLILFIVMGVILVTITIDFAAAEIINHIHYMGRHVGKAKELAGKMLQIAQSINVNKGISVGMTQLHALARFGMLGGAKLDQKGGHPIIPTVQIAFSPALDDEDLEYMDQGIPSSLRTSHRSIYNI